MTRLSPNRKARDMRRFRAANPAYSRREADRQRARREALEALARRHPAEFTALYDAELRHAGLDVVPLERPCPCGGVVRRPGKHAPWPAGCGDCAEAGDAG